MRQGVCLVGVAVVAQYVHTVFPRWDNLETHSSEQVAFSERTNFLGLGRWVPLYVE